jgi:hypothetical protein
VVFQVPLDEKPALDAAEGRGAGYSEIRCTVEKPGGETVTVFMYVADASAIDEFLLPFTWYKCIVLCGAREHELPPAYVDAINETECHDDPNTARANSKLRRAGLLG